MEIETATSLWTVWVRRKSGNLTLASFKIRGPFSPVYDGPVFASPYEAHEFVEEHGDPLARYVVAPVRGLK